MYQLMPLPLNVSCFSKIQIGFTFLVPAHPGSPGHRAVKRVCVCVDYSASSCFVITCRSANLILNLFSLMVDANVPDIALEPDKTVKKVSMAVVVEIVVTEAGIITVIMFLVLSLWQNRYLSIPRSFTQAAESVCSLHRHLIFITIFTQ